MSLQCPSCKESIDDDSFYCDQCAAELRRCVKCGRLGTRTRCSVDGEPLVAIKSAGAPGADSPVAAAGPVAAQGPSSVSPPPVAAQPAPGTASVAATGTTRIVSGAVNLRLTNAQHGIDVRPASGALIGRGAGDHVDVFSRFPQISTRHLQLRRDDAGLWWAKDVGSFNHSFYNGVKLVAQNEICLAPGGTLSLANIALTVSFE